MTLQGSWIWYEIMTPDAEGSKAFYDRVVGWNIQTTHGEDTGYGFINTAGGGMVGGVLHLTDEMRQHAEAAAAAGVTELLYTPSGPDWEREMRAFAKAVLA